MVNLVCTQNIIYRISIVALVLVTGSCGSSKMDLANSSIDQSDPLWQQAEKLAKEFLISDGHIDVPYRLTNKWDDISERTSGGDFDYPRALAGGLDAPFMSIYIPSSYQETGGAKAFADTLIDMVYGLTTSHPSKFAPASSTDELLANFKGGLISLPMGMENGAPIEDDLSNVEYFRDRGIRYITLTHSTDNLIGDSSYDTTGTWGGLSPFGKDVVAEMNRVGIMVDISHVSDNTFYDVLKLTKTPVIASHSSARHFVPGWERNMSDDMMKELAKNGGVIMVNFGSTFISAESRARRTLTRSLVNQFVRSRGLDPDSKEAQKYQAEIAEKYPMIYADVEDVADHFDHIVKLAGIDHVGFGSDYDGVGDTLPVGLKDVASYPNLIYVLLKRGYTEADIRKICSGNLLRVWRKVEKVAENG